jgi:UDP-N-acetylmuramoyl-tripeptide--D-alanyl-D-alanine ligase
MTILKQTIKKIFQYEARIIIRKYKPKIIAITGSVGKTSTKEALYLIMSKKFFVRKSEKSFTAELGVPMTIIGCPRVTNNSFYWVLSLVYGLKLIFWKNHYPDWLILEIDGDKPGDLGAASRLITPNILIITAIGSAPSHIELFSDIEVFLKEKKILVNSVARNGVIIFNADDNNSSLLTNDSQVKKVSCGIGSGCDVNASEYKILYGNGKLSQIPTGMMFDISRKPKKHMISIFQSIGVNNVYACLLAFSAGLELNISEEEMVNSLNKFRGLPGRMNIIPGIKNTLILDDSYNSSPVALSQALDVISQLKISGRKILVIGDMLELGKYSAEEHRKSAHKMKEIADFVICVGIRARLIADELLILGFPELKIIQTDMSEEAGIELQKIIEEGDVILIKGSQDMRMEKIVEEVMHHPQDKEKLLVRQEPDWQDN